MADFKVYVTDGRHSNYDIERAMLAQINAELYVCQCVTEEDVIQECSDADAILLDMAPMGPKRSVLWKNVKSSIAMEWVMTMWM